MSFQIITDSAANIPTPMIEKMGVAVIPFYYYIDGQEYTCTDTETFDGHAYYDMIRARTKVNTSQINPQTYAEFMEQFLKQGLDVLYISMSSGISSSFNSAQMGAEMLREQYPERQICLVDTLGASLGEGLAVFKAVEWREQGLVLAEVERRLKLYCKRMYQIFSVDDLMHLKRTGRLSNAAAIVGMVLQIKPLLKGNEKGQLVCIQKERGRRPWPSATPTLRSIRAMKSSASPTQTVRRTRSTSPSFCGSTRRPWTSSPSCTSPSPAPMWVRTPWPSSSPAGTM